MNVLAVEVFLCLCICRLNSVSNDLSTGCTYGLPSFLFLINLTTSSYSNLIPNIMSLQQHSSSETDNSSIAASSISTQPRSFGSSIGGENQQDRNNGLMEKGNKGTKFVTPEETRDLLGGTVLRIPVLSPRAGENVSRPLSVQQQGVGDIILEGNEPSLLLAPNPNASEQVVGGVTLHHQDAGLMSYADIIKDYDESTMTRKEKQRLLMSVYVHAQPRVFTDDQLKPVKRIVNEHIVSKLKFIPNEFLNDMNKSQKHKATCFGSVYQPDFTDSDPNMASEILSHLHNADNMPLQVKATTWMGISKTVKETIRSYRNNVQTKIKGVRKGDGLIKGDEYNLISCIIL